MIKRIGALLLIYHCLAGTSVSATEGFQISGWDEALVSVRSFDPYHEFFTRVAGWELRAEGDVQSSQLKAWGLSDSTSARYRQYANKGGRSGLIRLLTFEGARQRLIRPDAQAWDTGGIFDLNVRVADIERVAPLMRALGWQARAPITEVSFGPYRVKEWIVRGPDGLELAMIERLEPALSGWPNLKSVSRSFNATQVVRDQAQSLAFFKEVLGFKRYLEYEGASQTAGPNVLGLPHNLTTRIRREVVILSPDGRNEGSIELVRNL